MKRSDQWLKRTLTSEMWDELMRLRELDKQDTRAGGKWKWVDYYRKIGHEELAEDDMIWLKVNGYMTEDGDRIRPKG